MSILNQIRISWTGLRGMPGVSTFYLDGEATLFMSAFKTFFDGFNASFPTGLRITYPTTGVKIDTASGQAVGTWSTTAVADTVGSGGGTYAAPVGAVVNWHTGAYVGGRELRGKTFIVPIISSQFDTDGSLGATWLGFARTTANNLIDDTQGALRVYSRKSNTFSDITSSNIPDKACVLRSRRD